MSLSTILRSPSRHNKLEIKTELRSAHGPIDLHGDRTLRTPRPRSSRCEPSTLPSDEDLLSRYRDTRRPEEFAELVRRYSGELGRYLVRYRGDSTLAEDVLQETFLRVHAKCHLYRDGWPARAWLYAIAIHCAVDALRRSGKLPTTRLDGLRTEDETVDSWSLLEVLASAELGPLEALEERERQQWVRESVARLPEAFRQVLVLAYYQGLTNAEIVGLLGIPLGTVKSRLHGAIARLRAMAERTGRP